MAGPLDESVLFEPHDLLEIGESLCHGIYDWMKCTAACVSSAPSYNTNKAIDDKINISTDISSILSRFSEDTKTKLIYWNELKAHTSPEYTSILCSLRPKLDSQPHLFKGVRWFSNHSDSNTSSTHKKFSNIISTFYLIHI